MEQYFESYLQQIKKAAGSRDLTLEPPQATVSNVYIPGIPGTHGSMPEILPHLSIKQKIRGPAGELEIEVIGELPITEEQKARESAEYTDNGINERILAVYSEKGYVPLASYVEGEPKLSYPDLRLVFSPPESVHPQFCVSGTSDEPTPKVHSPLSAFDGLQFNNALRRMFKILTGETTLGGLSSAPGRK